MTAAATPTGPTGDDEFIQLLDHTGVRTPSARFDATADKLGTAQLLAAWRDMVLLRRFDLEATALQRQGQLALYVPARGQEAAQVGSALALAPQDFVFPSYREHGVLRLRGLDPVNVLRLLRGVDHGGWDTAAQRVHLYTLVIGSHTLHATGYAQGIAKDGLVGTGEPTRDEAVICYFGDGATSQGDTNEALVFAAASGAPIVFFCQNNQWAISVPATTQSRVPFARRGLGVGMPTIRIDGNDLLAAYAATSEAMQRARSGGGPTFIEAVTYRMGAHTTSDDPTRYRTRAEEEYWAQRDPIVRLENYLGQALTPRMRADMQTEADEYGQYVRTTCLSLEAPPVTAMLEHVYATEHAAVSADAAFLADYHREG